MGVKSRLKRQKRQMISRNGAPGIVGPTDNPPDAFQNLLLKPVNCYVELAGGDPKKPLPDGQLMVTLDKYAVVPLKRYKQLLKLTKHKMEAVQTALKVAKAEAARRAAMTTEEVGAEE